MRNKDEKGTGDRRETLSRINSDAARTARLFIFVRTIATGDAANARVTGQVDTSLSARPVADEEAQRGVSSSLLAEQGTYACGGDDLVLPNSHRRPTGEKERERDQTLPG